MSLPVLVLLTGGGPLDGKRVSAPADVTEYWAGDMRAAWVTELDAPAEQVVTPQLGCYQLAEIRSDGLRVFRWLKPA